MSKFISLALTAGLASVAWIAIAQQSTPKIKVVPMQQTSPVSGQQMYAAYCASCHGASGKGNGPAASALKIPPADLTLLSQKNNGTFPSAHVSAVLEFGTAIPAHGSVEMPIWGTLFPLLNPSGDSQMEVKQRINNLTSYLKQLQK
jgi:mono/diheme cytochrome c family protein